MNRFLCVFFYFRSLFKTYQIDVDNQIILILFAFFTLFSFYFFHVPSSSWRFSTSPTSAVSWNIRMRRGPLFVLKNKIWWMLILQFHNCLDEKFDNIYQILTWKHLSLMAVENVIKYTIHLQAWKISFFFCFNAQYHK